MENKFLVNEKFYIFNSTDDNSVFAHEPIVREIDFKSIDIPNVPCDDCKKKLSLPFPTWSNRKDKISKPFIVTHEEMTEDFKAQSKISNEIREKNSSTGEIGIMRRALWQEMESAREELKKKWAKEENVK